MGWHGGANIAYLIARWRRGTRPALLALLGAACSPDMEGTPAAPRSAPVRTALFVARIRSLAPSTLPRAVVRLAVPVSNEYQRIYRVTIVPAPLRLENVPTGGRVAYLEYRDIHPGEVRWAWMLIRCRLRPFAPERRERLLPIPWELRARCLGSADKVDPRSPLLQRQAALLVKTPKTPSMERIKAINEFITRGFEYELDNRQVDAEATLTARSGSCSELSRLFVGLARACNVPARFAAGSIVRRRRTACVDLVHHRWVEVFLPEYGWFPIDISTNVTRKDPTARFGALAPKCLVYTRNAGLRDSPLYATAFTLAAPPDALARKVRTYWFLRTELLPEMLRVLRRGTRGRKAEERVRKAAALMRGVYAVPFLAMALYEPIAGGHPEKAVSGLVRTGARTAVVPLVDFAEFATPAQWSAVAHGLKQLTTLEFETPAAWHEWLYSKAGRSFLAGGPPRKALPESPDAGKKTRPPEVPTVFPTRGAPPPGAPADGLNGNSPALPGRQGPGRRTPAPQP